MQRRTAISIFIARRAIFVSPARAINVLPLSQLCAPVSGEIAKHLFKERTMPGGGGLGEAGRSGFKASGVGGTVIVKISPLGERKPSANPDAVLLIRQERRNNKRTIQCTVCCDYSASWLFVFHSGDRYRTGGSAETISRGARVTAEISRGMSSTVYHPRSV